ncbi:MAG: thioesterase [Rhodobacteraceae bacterium]|nr:thioesterase [Paracoccaceae bacterium]MBR26462.1 thioesterase [Paracoccaceae bacterium]
MNDATPPKSPPANAGNLPDPSAATIQQTLGLHQVVFQEGGRAIVEYRAGMHMCHSGGIVQGGFVTGWIDSAMAHAAFSLGREDVAPLSLEMKTSFFAPARPGIVTAEAWIERAGGATCFAEGVLRDAQGAVLAKASSTIRLASLKRAQEKSREALAAAAAAAAG